VLEKRGDFLINKSVAAHTIALPFYNRLEKRQVEYVVGVLTNLVRRT